MKRNFIIFFCSIVLLMPSCKKYLDINKSPNVAVSIDPKLLFSFATTSFINLRSSGDLHIPMVMGGQIQSDGGNNPTSWGFGSQEYQFSPNFFSNTWNFYYTRIGANLKQIISLAESAVPKNNNAAAQAKVLLAYSLYDLTTIYGDVPFSEAWQPTIPYPKFDAQKDVLEGALALLDEALSQFEEASPLKISDYDLFYRGNIARWKKAAKSLKLRTLMTMVDKDPSKATQIGLLVNEPPANRIGAAEDNFQVLYFNTTGKKNPKFSISEQYNGGVNFFFGSTYVVDFMRNLNDPRLPKFFTKPAGAINYAGIDPGDDGDDNLHVRVSNGLEAADAPEVIFSYQEELFYEAEIQARGLGVPVNLANANALYKKAVEESCKSYGVPAGTAAAFAAGLPVLVNAVALTKLIHYHHWVDEMDRGLDAFTEWRRSGPDGDEVPLLTLPIGAPAGPLFRRYEYPSSTELGANPNAPALVRFNVKMWFDL